MMYMDRTGMELYKVKLKEGQLPQKENDIVVSKGILEALGQNGKSVTLSQYLIRF